MRKNLIQEFTLEKIQEIRHYLIKDKNQNELMSNNRKKFCRIILTILLDVFSYLLSFL